ncbi:hypothetical protein POCGH01_00200100 [Plasmodium ovale]|uniref:Uncharacterized protein n=1 Tax=Plasmodium ovale TaxID=36330 RepID=A0A1D3JEZ8_PLAOA|nr:hypothetical protein POCGH01_00200100 [Plasmodium ovale]
MVYKSKFYSLSKTSINENVRKENITYVPDRVQNDNNFVEHLKELKIYLKYYNNHTLCYVEKYNSFISNYLRKENRIMYKVLEHFKYSFELDGWISPNLCGD